MADPTLKPKPIQISEVGQPSATIHSEVADAIRFLRDFEKLLTDPRTLGTIHLKIGQGKFQASFDLNQTIS